MQKKLPWETCSVPKSTEGQTATPVIFKAPSMGSRHSRLPWGDHYTGMKYCQRHRCGKGMATCGQSRNCLAEMRGLSEKKIKWLGQRDSDRLADESWDQGIQKSVIQFSIPLWCSTGPKKKKKKLLDLHSPLYKIRGILFISLHRWRLRGLAELCFCIHYGKQSSGVQSFQRWNPSCWQFRLSGGCSSTSIIPQQNACIRSSSLRNFTEQE